MADSTETDKALVRRVLTGDEDAFNRFFDRIGPALYRFARARLRDDDTTEDVVQATLCQAIRKLHTYRGEAALLTWMCTLCRHEIFAYVKRHGAEQRVDLDEDQSEIRAALESLHATFDAESPDSGIEREQVVGLVQSTLDHLPAHYASVLEWKYIDELSVREIAGQLGVGTKAAESLLTRARNAFRDAFRTLVRGGPSQLGYEHE
jgi:RNA polymerase sigma-70 factor (ECF subfamily)